jgi:hypothetical protein
MREERAKSGQRAEKCESARPAHPSHQCFGLECLGKQAVVGIKKN